MKLPAATTLLEPWVRTGESSLVWAPTGVGKSWFALSVALAVAGGGEVMGWRAPAPSKVLYIDGEMHAAEMQERLKLLVDKTVTGLDLEAADENLIIQCRQQQSIRMKFWDMLDDVDQDALVVSLTRQGIELVIFDNFTTLSDSLSDENSAGAMKPALTLMLKLKAAGIAAILIHHANKGGDNYRGSTAIAATFEVILGLREVDSPVGARRNAAGFLLQVDKFRRFCADGSMDARQFFLVDGRWEVDGVEDTQAVTVVSALRSRRYASQAEIAEAVKLSKATVSRVLKRAVLVLKLITEKEKAECFEAALKMREPDDFEAGTASDFEEGSLLLEDSRAF